MAPTPHVKIIKHFTYRGSVKPFSNAYHFNGGTPADGTHWHTLMDAVVDAEKEIYRDDVTIVSAVGYAAGSEVPVHTEVYDVDGVGSFTGATNVPGDCAALLRYATTARTSKNHPVYLFNYFHGALGETGNPADELNPFQLAAIEDYADAWMSGFSDGTITAVRAGPNGATAVSRLVATFIKHRDFSN